MGIFRSLIEKIIGKKKQQIDLTTYEENSKQIDMDIKKKIENLNVFSQRLLNNEMLLPYREQELDQLRGRVTDLLEYVDDIEFCDTISDVIKFLRINAIYRVVCESIIQKKDIEELKQLHKDVRQILIHAALKHGIYKNKSEISWTGFDFDVGGKLTETEKKFVGLVYVLMRISSFIDEPTTDYAFDLKKVLSKLKVKRLCGLSKSQYLFS